MLAPKRTRRRKVHRGRMRGLAHRGCKVSFGQFGLMALEPAWITARQIEASRIAITRHIKRGGKVWIRIFPDKPVTKKPAEVRMGKGRDPRNSGYQSLSPVESCSSWAGFRNRLRVKR